MKISLGSMVVCVVVVSFAASPGNAADPAKASGSSGDQAAQANNPLANLKTFNLHNYYISELSGTEESANQFWLRYAQPLSTPLGSWLIRASLPVSRLPVGEDSESGLGDANAFAAYLFDTGNPRVSLGVGPLFGIPTATDDALGTDQWSAGLAAVLFNASHPTVQWGGLVTYQHKIGGSSRAPNVNLLAVQPFGIVQSFARTKGLYGGVALEGMVIGPQSKMNQAYYGVEVSPLDILVKHEVTHPGAAKLVEGVSQVTHANK